MGEPGDGSVKSKSPASQVNEVLAKVLCHNICVLIQSFYELGIDAQFAPAPPDPAPAGNIINLNDYRNRRAY